MSRSEKKTTIYDIAKELEISPSTVSSALNGTWKARRISEKKALHIQQVAREKGYYINMQARGLRAAKSGMVGLLIPQHDSRFFASLAQEFDHSAKSRGLCPIVIATERESSDELKTAETLISFSVDALFIAGASNPDAISELCRQAAVPHINLDLPGSKAPSIVTDNFSGATDLVSALRGRIGNACPHTMVFIGGNSEDYATSERIRGFNHATSDLPDSQCAIYAEGYLPKQVQETASRIFQPSKPAPAGVFVNSITAFEGIIQFMQENHRHPLRRSVIGCFDYHPFLAYVPYNAFMVRQNVEEMIHLAFECWERGDTGNHVVKVKPELVINGA
ncbi:putative transcriptional regulator [Vibrio nigripulchritudo SOn1]|uniref:Transcriptional regulator n=1 Tax=Vibrio nigripulchritudo SOn1 TaxID=1238450 RepID=A0AAV2VSZ5_9VIBR|nr:LacI family DNA-binding transcriptional regulator [Vibrio nigripulchritudo]CCO47558.1 putative transcriptional regulator [Vibrio nigripulchritudo SOn1]